MCWPAGAEYPRVAKEIVIKLDRADDRSVDDRAGGAVPAIVGDAIVSGEKYYLVVFANDDECNFWIEAEFCARVCGDLRKGSPGTQGRTKRESKTYFGQSGALR
jgi:hypothetical protein